MTGLMGGMMADSSIDSEASAAAQVSTLRAAALILGLSVALGAFGAHALAVRLGPDGARIWQTAVRYQVTHGLSLLALASLWRLFSPTARRVVTTAFLVGIALFSGSLYALALGAPRALGMITPLGGLAFLTGWVTVLRCVSVSRRQV